MTARILVALLMASPLLARDQSQVPPPNLSGHWRIDESLSQLDGAGGWFTNDCEVTQTAKEITFASVGSGPGTGRSTFATDGVAKRQQTPFGTKVEKSEWRGDRFVITVNNIDTTDNATSAREKSSTRTVTVFLNRDGLLIVDVTQSPPSAGHFAVHSVYRKQ